MSSIGEFISSPFPWLCDARAEEAHFVTSKKMWESERAVTLPRMASAAPFHFLLPLIGIVLVCRATPIMKSVEEKKVPAAVFWPYIVHSTRFQAAQRPQSDEKEDYYDAVRDEDATAIPSTTTTTTTATMKGRTTSGGKKAEEEQEARQLQLMMMLLQANVNPVPMLTAGTPKPTQKVSEKRKELLKKPSMLRVDAETYDDERVEAGKDDEELAEAAAEKRGDKELKQHKLLNVMLDGPDAGGIREADAEADGLAEGDKMPSKGTVDGQTHFLVDGETGAGAKMTGTPSALGRPAVDGEVSSKRSGTAQFPKPPEAEIVRMAP
uniref:Uncharacterized protein n=1 Tax=Globodera rostochiensis TaxID=31243 RepID=A0A914I6U4_GLORO